MDSLFEYRNCPNCGQNDFEVLFESNMKPDDFNLLFDYSMEEHDSQEDVEGYLVPGKEWGRHVKCKNCQLIYMNPMEKVSKTNEYYSKAKNTHAPTIRESYLRTAESQVRLVRKYANGTNLLDIGCAQGFFLFDASKAGYTAKGIEIAQDAATYARREFGLDIEAKPFEELQFAENYFDVVTLWQVLEHVPYPLMMLKEVHRILKPGGLLVVSTPNIEAIPAKILRKRWWDIKRLHINQFTTRTLTDILQNTGFKNISSASYRGFVSLSILLTMMLKYLGVYEQLKALFNPDYVLGKILNKIMLVYSSRLNHCVVLGFK
jgi:2-polyprenyl-3-methyl-5-hydroxy-6-metoxy-1,4-benzoquinol methylase